MPPEKKPVKDQLTERVLVRFTKQEFKDLAAMRKHTGVTTSQRVRTFLLAELAKWRKSRP